MENKGKLVGMNLLTGRGIYLTPEEEAMAKKQWKQLFLTLLIMFGVFVVLPLLMVFIFGVFIW